MESRGVMAPRYAPVPSRTAGMSSRSAAFRPRSIVGALAFLGRCPRWGRPHPRRLGSPRSVAVCGCVETVSTTPWMCASIALATAPAVRRSWWRRHREMCRSPTQMDRQGPPMRICPQSRDRWSSRPVAKRHLQATDGWEKASPSSTVNMRFHRRANPSVRADQRSAAKLRAAEARRARASCRCCPLGSSHR